ncbi:MAG: heavy metal translocating P-type ATPase [Alphaproteobacteria bacterium]|nr:heavy metal translocating P-type ATPase [Alphaproteobacteria bacterium]
MTAHLKLVPAETRQNFRIEGMTCASCVRRVEQAIAKVPGVKSAAVNLATETADVIFSTVPDASAVVDAIGNAGYSVAAESAEFEIEGMTCASCVRRVELAIASVPGVLKASVNLSTERATVETAGATPSADIEAAVRQIGYEVRRAQASAIAQEVRQEAKDREMRHLQRDLLIAAVLTLPIFLLEMGSHLIPSFHHWLMSAIDRQQLHVGYFVLATAVQFGPGLRFYEKGLPALARLAPDMNSLVILGSTAAWAYSVVATFAPSLLPAGTANVYFEASAVIVTLILLGRFFEAKAKGRTSDAIKHLVGLQAKSARVERNGAFIEIGLEDVHAGDIIQVRPGDKVPVDGNVIAGSSYVDESMISGEPVPVIKEAGAEVVGGTINKTGVAWHLIVRMRRFRSDLAFYCENLGGRILKLTAFEKRHSTCELGLSCSRWRQ